MKTISSSIFLRKCFTKKDGSTPIYLRVVIDRQKLDISLNLSVFENQWNSSQNRIIGATKDVMQHNLLLQKYINKANDIIFKYQINSENVTIEDFKNDFFENHINKLNFFEFMDYYIKNNNHKYSSETLRTYKSQITKLKKFQEEVFLHKIDLNFLKKYEKFMIVELKNSQNTYYKSLSFIKSVMNLAINEDLIKETPFKKFKLKKIIGHRDFLNMQELKVIHNFILTTTISKYSNTGFYFLFSCYTGLRFSDIKQLQYSNVVDNILEIKQHKTKDIVRIPLNEKAISLIDKSKKEGLIFKTLSNQKTNQHLKEIADACNIKKNITFHVARHTFATVGITLGIPIEVVSKLLGHTDIKTTQIYAKIVDDVKIKEINKFDLF